MRWKDRRSWSRMAPMVVVVVVDAAVNDDFRAV
jgi:hypothetical protein